MLFLLYYVCVYFTHTCVCIEHLLLYFNSFSFWWFLSKFSSWEMNESVHTGSIFYCFIFFFFLPLLLFILHLLLVIGSSLWLFSVLSMLLLFIQIVICLPSLRIVQMVITRDPCAIGSQIFWFLSHFSH